MGEAASGGMSEAAMQAAVRARDATADGTFYFAVLTTGVFCFPSCRARTPRPENLRFFATAQAARHAGFRPCLRCRPDLPPRAERARLAVQHACAAIAAGEDFDAGAFARQSGMSQAALQAAFASVTGLSVAAYRAALRQDAVRAGLARGLEVTQAAYEAGFNSSGRFYEAADAMLGMTPGRFRAKGEGESITYAHAACSLGRLLVAWASRGVCAILLGDADEALVADLHRRFARAALHPAAPEQAAQAADVVALIEEPRAAHGLPLDIRGSAFQHRVWQALRGIPAGETRSYAQLAASLGKPGAARAVASACAANPLAVAVPCHRVVRGDGDLAGYAWGVARKRALLAREALLPPPAKLPVPG